MKKYLYTIAAALLVTGSFSGLDAALTIKDGWLVDADEVPTLLPEEHFEKGLHALQHCKWKEAAKQFRIVTANFPYTTYGQDGFFYLGIAYYNLGEYEVSNNSFTSYLKCYSSPEHFEETLKYKFSIANQFRNGARKRVFGWQNLPKWMPGTSLAIPIYDEVIAAVPCHELAAMSLFAKAILLRDQYDYRGSIEVYQQLIRRFPKHELAPQSYLEISRVYLDQSKIEANNPDILSFAHINLRRFKNDFPRHESLLIAEKEFSDMKEVYAKALYETGQFYERKGHPKASVIYYQRALENFPDTEMAHLCEKRLIKLTGSVTLLKAVQKKQEHLQDHMLEPQEHDALLDDSQDA